MTASQFRNRTGLPPPPPHTTCLPQFLTSFSSFVAVCVYVDFLGKLELAALLAQHSTGQANITGSFTRHTDSHFEGTIHMIHCMSCFRFHDKAMGTFILIHCLAPPPPLPHSAALTQNHRSQLKNVPSHRTGLKVVFTEISLIVNTHSILYTDKSGNLDSNNTSVHKLLLKRI